MAHIDTVSTATIDVVTLTRNNVATTAHKLVQCLTLRPIQFNYAVNRLWIYELC
jgi:hypothetical protein